MNLENKNLDDSDFDLFVLFEFVKRNKRLKNIELIDEIFVQEFNNTYALIKIKYLGKLDKIINQLKEQKIILSLKDDQWRLELKR